MKRALVMDPNDNVGNALDDILAGDVFEFEIGGSVKQIKATDEIPFGFKVAVADIKKSGSILKYNQPVGVASEDIKAGECVHIHNVEGARGRGDQEAIA